MMPSRSELKAGLVLIAAVAEAIREAGRILSGTLYAMLMGKIDYQAYQKLIQMLKNADLVREEAHELIWIGPEFAKGKTSVQR